MLSSVENRAKTLPFITEFGPRWTTLARFCTANKVVTTTRIARARDPTRILFPPFIESKATINGDTIKVFSSFYFVHYPNVGVKGGWQELELLAVCVEIRKVNVNCCRFAFLAAILCDLARLLNVNGELFRHFDQV